MVVISRVYLWIWRFIWESWKWWIWGET